MHKLLPKLGPLTASYYRELWGKNDADANSGFYM